MKKKKNPQSNLTLSHTLSTLTPYIFFFIGFLLIPMRHISFFSTIPGDVVDARVNAYLLENVYSYFFGKSASLIHLNVFFPYPYILGLSDNLFGSSPFYILGRLITGQVETAFQIWYLIGFVLNFVSSHFALKKLGLGSPGSIFGALLFTFGLPALGQMGHPQLHYRFGIPLAILYWHSYIKNGDLRDLAKTLLWLVWQYYCTIYMGFFLSLFLFSMALMGVLSLGVKSIRLRTLTPIQAGLASSASQWKSYSGRQRVKIIFSLIGGLLALIVLFYPYWKASQIYGFKRHPLEISPMLPRPESYLLADLSWLWASQSDIFANIPFRWEHQLFIGLIPALFSGIGVALGLNQRSRPTYVLLIGSLVILVGLSLFWSDGSSLWLELAALPLFSAIRSVTRIILLFLFPLGFLSGLTLDAFCHQKSPGSQSLARVLTLLLILECSAHTIVTTPKTEWVNRRSELVAQVPSNLPKNAVLYFAPRPRPALNSPASPFDPCEIDAMWAAYDLGLPVINGYSGNYPPGYFPTTSDNCREVTQKIQIIQQLSQIPDFPSRGSLNQYQIVPIGFKNCTMQANNPIFETRK